MRTGKPILWHLILFIFISQWMNRYCNLSKHSSDILVIFKNIGAQIKLHEKSTRYLLLKRHFFVFLACLSVQWPPVICCHVQISAPWYLLFISRFLVNFFSSYITNYRDFWKKPTNTNVLVEKATFKLIMPLILKFIEHIFDNYFVICLRYPLRCCE
jgi:hypothetical protein